MAGSINKVILIGNLGTDPQIRRLPSGESVANLFLITNESWRDKQTGERKDRSEAHSVVIFNENLVKVAEQYLKKGAKVYIEGQLQTRKFQDKNGVEREKTEVVLQRFRGELTMLDGRADRGDRGGMGEAVEDYGRDTYGGGRGGSDYGRSSPMEPRPAGGGRGAARPPMNDPDDEIPF